MLKIAMRLGDRRQDGVPIIYRHTALHMLHALLFVGGIASYPCSRLPVLLPLTRSGNARMARHISHTIS